MTCIETHPNFFHALCIFHTNSKLSCSANKIHELIPLRLVEERVLSSDQMPPAHAEVEITPIWSWTGHVLSEHNPGEVPLGDAPPNTSDMRSRQRQRKVKRKLHV